MKIKDYKLSEIMRLCKEAEKDYACVNCPLFAYSDNLDKTICQELFGENRPCDWTVEVTD